MGGRWIAKTVPGVRESDKCLLKEKPESQRSWIDIRCVDLTVQSCEVVDLLKAVLLS
jgi:hypothetical protein